MWAPHDKHFRHPDVGVLTFATTSLGGSDLPECGLVVCTPADDETRAKIAQINAAVV